MSKLQWTDVLLDDILTKNGVSVEKAEYGDMHYSILVNGGSVSANWGNGALSEGGEFGRRFASVAEAKRHCEAHLASRY